MDYTTIESIQKKHKSSDFIELENEFLANNYSPIPVAIDKGKGVFVWDAEGKQYFDFLSSYSAVNQGHCHPRLLKVMNEQSKKLTLTSRAFYNTELGKYAKYITDYFGYQKILPMNSGVEAVETAIKLTRKWGVVKKGIRNNRSQIIVCDQNFHGRTTTVVSFSSDNESKDNFGPFTPGFITTPYNDLPALERILKSNEDIAGFLVEPIQGEAGVRVPDDDYCSRANALCKKYNVLFIADEIQSGMGRTGGLLSTCGECHCNDHCNKNGRFYTRPDILILGKALSGGLYPVSAVLSDSKIMDVLEPGQHGSTYGGNPLACKIAVEALKVLKEEHLMVNARKLGKIFRQSIQEYISTSKIVSKVRGKGLLNAMVIDSEKRVSLAWDICIKLKDNGLLAKPTHGNIIRFAPPLVITKKQLHDAIEIIINTLREFET